MFNSPTVFVLGAGASEEARLPIGSQLTLKIAALVDLAKRAGAGLVRGDPHIDEALRQLGRDEEWSDNHFYGSGQAVAEAMQLAPSIDTFLESHATNREFVLLGKMGIARAIAIAESESLLAPRDNRAKPFNMTAMSATWYVSLAQQMFTGVPVEEPQRAFENVSFIVFNYDRCLEVFLTRASQMYFRVTEAVAAELVGQIPIHHPYGWLGSAQPGKEGYVGFGDAELDVYAASTRIRTFSESVEAEAAGTSLAGAETVIFLGFAFHRQNLDLLARQLGGREPSQPLPRVFATTCGLSDSDVQVVRNQIALLFCGRTEQPTDKTRLATLTGKCSDLFGSYWRSLTA